MRKPFNISFEFFPPKTTLGNQQLFATAKILETSTPDFFSVTFGAGGSTRQGTLETVTMLQQHTTTKLAPPISCIGCERHEIIDILTTYKNMGIDHLVALRGDLPSGMGNTGEFKFASELVSLIREVTDRQFNIAVAAYPEFHPQAKSSRDDLLNLKRKYEAGANHAITQYFFNADAYFKFIEDCLKQHINFPIIPGIMPITQFQNLARFSDNCGAEIPRWIRKRLEFYADDQEAINQFGFEVVYNLCVRLIEGGAPGLHFYTLNKTLSLKLVAELNKEYSIT